MAYATSADVQAKVPQFVFSATTKPSLTDIAGLIAEVEAELDASLGNLGYVVPVTGAKSLVLVRTMVAYAALARTLDALHAGTGQASPVADTARKYYESRLTWLGDPKHPFTLPDAPKTDSAVPKPGDENMPAVVGSPELGDSDELSLAVDPRVTMDTTL